MIRSGRLNWFKFACRKQFHTRALCKDAHCARRKRKLRVFHDDRDEDVAKNFDLAKSAFALLFGATITGCTLTQHGEADFQTELKSVSPERYAAVFENRPAATRLPTVRPNSARPQPTRPDQRLAARQTSAAPRPSMAMPRGATTTNVAPTVEAPIPNLALAANRPSVGATGRPSIVAPPRVSVSNIPGREAELAALLQPRQPVAGPRDAVGRTIESHEVATPKSQPKLENMIVDSGNSGAASIDVPPPPIVLDSQEAPDTTVQPRTNDEATVANADQSAGKNTHPIPASPEAGIVGLIEGDFFDEPEPTSITQVADTKPAEASVFGFADGSNESEVFDRTVAFQPSPTADPLQNTGPKKPYNPPAESSRPAGDESGNRGLAPITSISLDAKPKPDPQTQNEIQFPEDIAKRELAKHGTIQHTTGTSRDWMMTEYSWEAPVMSHNPLYFEQENVERFGLTKSQFFQPLFSGAHFYSSMLILPYKTASKPFDDRVYAMGHYRPGNNVPPQEQDMKTDLTALSYQGAVSALLVFMFP